MSKLQVKIVNPAHGGGFTSLKNAKRFVAKKRARWKQLPSGGSAIEFVSGDIDAKVRETERARIYDGYDNRTRPLTPEEQRHVPVINITRKIHQRQARGRRTSPPRTISDAQ